MASVFNFEVANEDLLVRFSCPNHERRIAETIRICLKLGKYTLLSAPFVYGLDSNASKGIAMTRKEFREYCNK